MTPTTWRSVQRVSIPDAAPPYDCETHGAACPAARDHAESSDEPAATRPPGLVAWTAETQPHLSGPAAAAPGPAAPGLAGTTAAWPGQFARVMVEILAGVRPQRQIDPLTTDRVRAQIRHLGPTLAADRRPRVQRVVTSRPTAGVVEMTVVVSFGPRSRALAMRLEYVAAREAAPGLPTRPARWICTELEMG
jgi:uncharacterized protein DUF6459